MWEVTTTRNRELAGIEQIKRYIVGEATTRNSVELTVTEQINRYILWEVITTRNRVDPTGTD